MSEHSALETRWALNDDQIVKDYGDIAMSRRFRRIGDGEGPVTPRLLDALGAVDPYQDLGWDRARTVRAYSDETGIYEPIGEAVMTARCMQVFRNFYDAGLLKWVRDGIEAAYTLDLIGDTRRDDLLACSNGTVTLSEGKLENHSKLNRLVRRVEAEWRDPTEDEAALWDTTLRQWLPDADDRRLVQQVAGSILGDRVSPRQALYLVGTAGSGKSTLLKLLSKLSGGAMAAVGFDGMAERFAVSELATARINLMDDQSFSHYKANAVFKKVVSHEPMRMERKGRDGFMATTNCVCLLSGNDYPVFAGSGDAGIWDRLVIVEMRSALEGDTVLGYENILWRDASAAILAWAYDGWQSLSGASKYTAAVGRHAATVSEAQQASDPLAALLAGHYHKDLSVAVSGGMSAAVLSEWAFGVLESEVGMNEARRLSAGRNLVPMVKKLFGFDAVGPRRIFDGKKANALYIQRTLGQFGQ